MRFAVVWIAFGCWAPIAAAQVSFERHDAADDKVARALEQLIDQPVAVASAADGGGSAPAAGASVSIDRARAIVRVVTREHPAGLSRTLDPSVVAASPYAVALAAAELLDMSKLARSRPPASVAVNTPAISVRVEPATPTNVVAPSAPLRREAVAPPSAAIAVESSEQAAAEPRSLDEETTAPREAHVVQPEAEPPPPPPPAVPAPASARPIDSSPAAPGGLDPRSSRSSGLPDYALGVDLELQAQPGNALSFVRPAVYGELAWGRGAPGAFWALGARVSAPLSRELQPSAAETIATSVVDAQALDAALQASVGFNLGLVGLAAHVAAGATYLRVEALDAERRELGHDDHVSPLIGAGIGARIPVAFGLALAVRGEAQWALQTTLYRIGGEPVLESGAVRAGVFAGILWESAVARTP